MTDADVRAGPYSGSRVLPLAGAQNFRDLGGYSTRDGRRVKWGKIFRSGNLSRLTPDDFEYLSKLEIKMICDLRTTDECRSEPNKWREARNITYWAREYRGGFGELRNTLASRLPTPEDAHAAMIAGYQQLPFDHARAYKELFARLAAGDVPLVVNCSAGKDRTGAAAAIVLSALNVPREVVIADYLLTERVLDTQKLLLATADKSMSAFTRHPPEIVAAVLRADASYLLAALDAIERKHGTLMAYLLDELGVTQEALTMLQENLLE